MYKRFSDSTKILLATRGTLRDPFIKKLVFETADILHDGSVLTISRILTLPRGFPLDE